MIKSERVILFGLPLAGLCVGTLLVLGLTQGNTATTAQGDLGQSNQRADSLQVKADQGKTLADQIGAACAAGGQTAHDLQEKFGACSQAVVVKQAPASPIPGPTGQQGKAGSNGAAGRGITSTSLRSQHLFVSYTDGVEEDKGQVVGADGKTGQPGRGISATSIAAGHLVLSYTDGTTADVGQVVGKDGTNGVNGTNGANGRGIAKTTITGNFHLVVTYTDGTTEDVGALPAGQNGKDGINGNDGQPPVGWTTKKLDGTTETCHRTQSFDYQNPYYECVQNAPEPSATLTPTGTP